MKVDVVGVMNARNSVLDSKLGHHALVVFSGGQDSSTCLALACKYFDKVTAINFNYGQLNNAELENALCVKQALGEHFSQNIHFKCVDVKSIFSQVCTSALLGNGQDVNEKHAYGKDLPASFVPNRNSMFFTIAHAYAQLIGATCIISGICASDGSDYPDTTEAFQYAIQLALNEGSRSGIEFVAPLLGLNKASTFELARELGALDIIIKLSHTCYNNNHEDLHDWGYGCDNCNGCKLRKEGYEQFEQFDKFRSEGEK